MDSDLRGDSAGTIAQLKCAVELAVQGQHVTDYRTVLLRKLVHGSAKRETWREVRQTRRGIA